MVYTTKTSWYNSKKKALYARGLTRARVGLKPYARRKFEKWDEEHQLNRICAMYTANIALGTADIERPNWNAIMEAKCHRAAALLMRSNKKREEALKLLVTPRPAYQPVQRINEYVPYRAPNQRIRKLRPKYVHHPDYFDETP